MGEGLVGLDPGEAVLQTAEPRDLQIRGPAGLKECGDGPPLRSVGRGQRTVDGMDGGLEVRDLLVDGLPEPPTLDERMETVGLLAVGIPGLPEAALRSLEAGDRLVDVLGVARGVGLEGEKLALRAEDGASLPVEDRGVAQLKRAKGLDRKSVV